MKKEIFYCDICKKQISSDLINSIDHYDICNPCLDAIKEILQKIKKVLDKYPNLKNNF